ncbi:hypothetical protein HTZ84_00595 [Haloterrigena sp. SYSU A558-1]|uniref:Uncharacterized protein n=1 Tax=Haloterrigena gelatinilytica TaxID=2741724 RepID=A0ABX2L3M8_9EURY|nr:hypothetical protein [Haloterrigena gelatinilytica]NUC70822.1 hypothetical protein [Haloterrigena gelatinilytica]
MTNDREACGRCSVSVAVDVANEDRDDDERTARNPHEEGRIEVDETELKTLSPDGWIADLSSRLNDAAQRVIWRR